MASKALLHNRILEAEARKERVALQSARRAERTTPKEPVRLTQDLLIAEALEVEEANRASLRRLLEREEALRRRARVGQKHEIQGSFLRWQSVGVEQPPQGYH